MQKRDALQKLHPFQLRNVGPEFPIAPWTGALTKIALPNRENNPQSPENAGQTKTKDTNHEGFRKEWARGAYGSLREGSFATRATLRLRRECTQ